MALRCTEVKRKVRVLLCDDHAVARRQVRRVIDDLVGFEVVGEADAGNVGVQMAQDLGVDLVVMDVSMPGMDGIEATRLIVAQKPEVKVVMFSADSDHQVVPRALSAGASGFLLKDASRSELFMAFQRIMAGERYVSDALQLDSANYALNVPFHSVNKISTPSRRALRVVLVDDSAVVRERVAATLSASGDIEVAGQAQNVPDGLRLIWETRPDLLILDIGLPGESGLALLESVQKQKLVPVIIMLTNQDHPRLRQHCFALGADFYFHKPTQFDAMLEKCFELAADKVESVAVSETPAPQKKIVPVADLNAVTDAERAEELARTNEALRREIRERERVEQALRESQERYQQFVRMTNEGVARYEADIAMPMTWSEAEQIDFILERTRVVECNDAFARQYGYTQATDAVGMRLADAMTGSREEKMMLVREFIRSGYRLSDLETLDRKCTGELTWIRNSLVGVVENNCLVRAWIVQQDITQRRQSEERIREQAQMLDLAHDAIVIRDLDDRVLFWNESAAHLFGWKAEEVLGKRGTEIFPSDMTASSEILKAVLASGEWSGEVSLRTRGGQPIIIQSRLTLIRDRHGNPKSILGINTDITERKQLEAQFLRAQRMESIGALAGGIAHDLNNILAPVIMSGQLLQMDAAKPEQQNLIRIILASAKRGADLVKQVLTFYRGDESHRQEIHPYHLVCELRHIISETFPKSIRVETQVTRDLWLVAGDPTQLHQVLLNLCVNARDAMAKGGELKITASNVKVVNELIAPVGSTEPTPHVLITVSDTGCGIAPEHREKIFQPFFTTKPPGIGTGLGLSTSLAIVKNHGGFIHVNSKPDGGAEFKVYLPAVAKTVSASSATEHFQMPRGNGELILVVDDEASVRMIMGQTLQTFGYRILTASDGLSAVSIYQQRYSEIAAVIVDMMMPVMDGVATIRKLAEINPNLRAIVASGWEVEKGRMEPVSNCVKAFLLKPYTAGTLLKMMNDVLTATDADSVTKQ